MRYEVKIHTLPYIEREYDDFGKCKRYMKLMRRKGMVLEYVIYSLKDDTYSFIMCAEDSFSPHTPGHQMVSYSHNGTELWRDYKKTEVRSYILDNPELLKDVLDAKMFIGTLNRILEREGAQSCYKSWYIKDAIESIETYLRMNALN